MNKIKVGVFVEPPWVEANFSTIKKPGITIDVVNLVCRTMKFDCEFHELIDPNYGHFENGTWHGMIKYLSTGEYDMSFPAFTPTIQRLSVVDFSDSVFQLPLIFMTRRPQRTPSLWNFLAFHWSVWIALLLLSLSVGVLLAAVQAKKWQTFFFDSFCNFLDSIAIMNQQGMNVRVVKHGSRLLIAVWAMASVIIGGVWSGHLLSLLIAPNQKLPFHNFETFVKCVEVHDCKMVTRSESISWVQDIYLSPDKLMNRLKLALSHNPLLIIEDDKKMMEKMIKTKPDYLVLLTYKADFLDHSMRNKDCMFATVLSGLTDNMCFPLRKHFHYREQLNSLILYINSLGIPEKIYHSYIASEADCNKPTIEGNPLQSTALLGPLFILMCGGAIGLGSLLFENLLFIYWFPNEEIL